MKIRVNGEERMEEACSIDELVRKLGYESKFVAVAVNFECVRRAEFYEKQIADGDEIEILSPQSGG
jgi:sulfur carrier protein